MDCIRLSDVEFTLSKYRTTPSLEQLDDTSLLFELQLNHSYTTLLWIYITSKCIL